MLAQLKGLFTPQAIAASMKLLTPLETTIMDTLFKDRPTHPLPLIGVSELVSVVQTVPVVRRDGTPVALKGETASMEFIAPLPVKVKIPVTASELNDLRVIFGDQAAVTAWRTRKIDQIRRTVRDTTEAMCAVVASTGKLTWPVELEGGHQETYEVDYGQLLTYEPAAKLTADSKLPDVYKLLRDMELEVKKGGLGGNVEFWAGSDVVAVLLGIVEQYVSTVETKPYRVSLEQGVLWWVATPPFHGRDLSQPCKTKLEWLPKLNPKVLLAVATNQPGKVWYCAIDSISANNAATPLHIVPVAVRTTAASCLSARPSPFRRAVACVLQGRGRGLKGGTPAVLRGLFPLGAGSAPEKINQTSLKLVQNAKKRGLHAAVPS